MLNLLYNNRLDIEVKGKEELKITLKVSYLKCQKKIRPFVVERLSQGSWIKLGKDFEKERNMGVLNWYQLGNIK